MTTILLICIAAISINDKYYPQIKFELLLNEIRII
jgi:hypothetical protein